MRKGVLVAKTPEGRVKNAIKKALMEEGLVQLVDFVKSPIPPEGMTGFFFMPVAGPFSVHGIHDFIGCWHGVFFSIEAKAEDNPSDGTPLQVDFQRAVSHAGGVSIIGARNADAVYGVKSAILEILDERKGT